MRRARRGVERIHLVGWSAGGRAVGTYALENPGKVERAVLLAPAFDTTLPDTEPAIVPQVLAPMGGPMLPEAESGTAIGTRT